MRILRFIADVNDGNITRSEIADIAYIANPKKEFIGLKFLQYYWHSLYSEFSWFHDVSLISELDVDIDGVSVADTGERFKTHEDMLHTVLEYRERNATLRLTIFDMSKCHAVGAYAVEHTKDNIAKLSKFRVTTEAHPMVNTDMYFHVSGGQVMMQGERYSIMSEWEKTTFREWFGMDGYDEDMFISQVLGNCNRLTYSSLRTNDLSKDTMTVGELVRSLEYTSIV